MRRLVLPLLFGLASAACVPGPGRAPSPREVTVFDAGTAAPDAFTPRPPPPPANPDASQPAIDAGTTSAPDAAPTPPPADVDSGSSTPPDDSVPFPVPPPPPPDAGTTAPDSGQTGQPGPLDPATLSRLRAAIDSARLSEGALGAGFGISIGGAGGWMGTSGSIVPNGGALLPTDAFQIGSVTKTFTAALVLLIVEQGGLTLDMPLSIWLPNFPGADQILLYHLLNHTSGIEDYLADPSLDWTQPVAHQDLLNYPAYVGLRFAPGTQYYYSNTNYILLGLIIEDLTGQSFAQVLRSTLLNPLGLTHTYLNGEEFIPGGYAPGVFVQGGAYNIVQEADPTLSWAAGGLVSTMDDMLLWFGLLANGSVLQPATLNTMLTGVQIPGTSTYYGLGVMYQQTARGLFFFHDGLVNDTGAVLGYLPDRAALVVSYVNTYLSSPYAIAQAGLDVVLP